MVCYSFFFFFNDTATTEIYTLSLHDALPISSAISSLMNEPNAEICFSLMQGGVANGAGQKESKRMEKMRNAAAQCALADRKSTRLNSSHLVISYAVFCLKKKKEMQRPNRRSVGKHITSELPCSSHNHLNKTILLIEELVHLSVSATNTQVDPSTSCGHLI